MKQPAQKRRYLFRVVAPHYVAGFEVSHQGMVLRAAPVLGWAVGKPYRRVERYLRNNGYQVENLW